MDKQELHDELIRLAPPAGVSLTTYLGLSLNEWVYIVTIIYTVLQCILILKKIFKTPKKDDNRCGIN